ncbi:alpha/beta fold hydrolase [Imbroritus primus]|uniref:alpha/beta fold hydrolase n=1 Tax=Imbroritus primus TaxID=3058603 RepID=UPI003D16151F
MDCIQVGAGPVQIVALHGIQGTRAAWLPLADMLADAATFTLPNLRGRGTAVRAAGPGGYALEAYAADAAEAIEARVRGPFILAGWSMGVSVALAYLARTGARRPTGLCLVSGTANLPEAPWFAATDAEALLAEVRARELRLGLKEAADHAAVVATWQAIRAQRQAGQLAAVREPALVIHGRDDGDSPWSHALALCAGLPHASLLGIGGAGHSVLTHNTEQVAAVLRGFLPVLSSPTKETR